MAYYNSDDDSIFHTCANCSTGAQIPKAKVVQGRPAGADKCDDCRVNETDGTCTPGTPGSTQ